MEREKSSFIHLITNLNFKKIINTNNGFPIRVRADEI